ncbi:MAG: helix-turn-helix domain-containing protein [Bacteroidales bacterium]
MELAKQILGKELYQLTYDDLVYFFSVPREETSLLEFKSGEVKVNSVFKEICAFLNTEGGLVIVGSPKERKIQKPGTRMKRVCHGELVPSRFRDKKWLLGLITANIVPPPKGIRIQEILTEQGNHFIIEVPQSKNPPHQFLTDGRYYIRVEQEARPAPHGIVEALFYKRQKAQLQVNVQINETEDKVETMNNVDIQISNVSQFPTDSVSYLIQLFNIEEVHKDGNLQQANLTETEEWIELKGRSEQVVVDDRILPLRLKVINKLQPFVISVLTWNKEAGMFKHYGIFDPVNFCYIDSYKTGDQEERTISDFVEMLDDYKKQLE